MSGRFDKAAAARIARTLVHCARTAAFGTLEKDGAPTVSHLAVATDIDGSPIFLASDLAVHTHNVRRDPRASLLFAASEGESADVNTRARLTLVGTVREIDKTGTARQRLLRRHEGAALYVDFADMRLMRLETSRAHLVAGFGRITNVPAADLLADGAAARALGPIDEGACTHLDEDHADALALIATRLGAAPAGEWRAVGVDPLGLDLASPTHDTRVEYDAPLSEPGTLRVVLKRLTERAREAAPEEGETGAVQNGQKR